MQINRTNLIKRVEDNLKLVKQWENIEYTNTGYLENVLKYAHRAEALIEAVEVFDCGSVGGFDGGHRGTPSLEERLQWLKEKRM